MKVQMKGLDSVMRKLDDLQKRAKNLDGSHKIPITQLLNESFMIQNTSFGSFDAMVKESGFRVESADDFAAIPDEKWDAFIAKATRFADWQAMLQAAGADWAKKELGL